MGGTGMIITGKTLLMYFNIIFLCDRYLSCELKSVDPLTAVSTATNQLQFKLLAHKSQSFYLLNELILELEINLTTKDNKVYPSTAQPVTVVNNLLHR